MEEAPVTTCKEGTTDATLPRKSNKTARHSWRCFVISLSLRCSHLKVTSHNSVKKQKGAIQVIEIVMIIIIGYRDESEWILASNVPKYCWPIPPRISHNREKFPVKKRSTFGPKCAMPVMRFLRRYARGLILSAFERIWNFMRVCRWNHWDWANRCRVICWKLISHWNWQSINASANISALWPIKQTDMTCTM